MPSVNTASKGYRDLPIADSHIHMTYPMPLGEQARMLRGYMDYFGCSRIALLGLPHSVRSASDDPANNLKVLYLKDLLNREDPERRIYASGGLWHFFDGRDTAEGFLRQVRDLYALGFDGLKVLLGKPELRARFGRSLSDPLLDGVWTFCEERGFPVTLHLGDPAAYWEPWDNGHPPAYGADLPTLEALRGEVDEVLAAHPDLPLTLCHFYFMGEEPERADRFLDGHPSVLFDLTPGSEMFAGFSKSIGEWRAFFHKHRERILFGTDTDNWAAPDTEEGYRHNFSYPFNLVRNALESPGPFRFEDVDWGELLPLMADEETLRMIYEGNFVRRFGEEPRPVDRSAAACPASALHSLYEHGILTPDGARLAADSDNLGVMEAYFRG